MHEPINKILNILIQALALACTQLYSLEWWTVTPLGKKGSVLFKTAVVTGVSVLWNKKGKKKTLVRGSISSPQCSTCSRLHIHLPGGLNHCMTDRLTWRWEPTSHAFPTAHRGCITVHRQAAVSSELCILFKIILYMLYVDGQ